MNHPSQRPQVGNLSGQLASSRQTRQRKWKPVSSRRKGGPLSIKTVNNILGALRAVLNLACEYQLIPACPRIKFDKADKADPKYLDRDEADRFLEAVPAEWMLFVLVMVETGLREGELLAMTGVPLAVVQRWLGHSSVQTTEIYAHLAPDTGAELIERVSRGRCAKITTITTTIKRRSRGETSEKRRTSGV